MGACWTLYISASSIIMGVLLKCRLQLIASQMTWDFCISPGGANAAGPGTPVACFQARDWHTSSVKVLRVNIFGFVGCSVTITMTQLSSLPWSEKIAIDNMHTNGHDSVSIKLYLQKQVAGWIWPLGRSVLAPALDHKFHVGMAIFYSLLCISAQQSAGCMMGNSKTILRME